MFSFIPLLLVAISGGLIVYGGVLIRKRGNPDTVEQRYFLFLIWIALGLTGMILIYWVFPHFSYSFLIAFVPFLPALFVMVFMHLREWRTLHRRKKVPILFAVGLVVFLIGLKLWLAGELDFERQLEAILPMMTLLFLSALLFIVWKFGKRYSIWLGIAGLIYLAFFNGLEIASYPFPPESISGSLALAIPLALMYLVIPGFVIPITALLTLNVLESFSENRDSAGTIQWVVVGRIVFGFILLASLVYTYVWLWIWDGTDDGVRWFLVVVATAFAAFSAGTLMSLTSSGWRRWAGLAYVVVIMAVVYLAGIGVGSKFSNYVVTEERAVQIREAVEKYHAKTGWYPFQLTELVPAELWHVPLPVIISGQEWCYEGGSNYYRLGAVYREHWSSPYLNVRIYASEGNAPDETWECDQRLVELQSRFKVADAVPSLEPLPASNAPVPRTPVEPILRESNSISVGNWSPDGIYLVFGMTDYFMDEVEQTTIDLRFLEATTGKICQPVQSEWTVKESDGLREHSAWLPDGRFLYVTDAGQMLAFQPCTDSIEDLASRYPVTFTKAVTFDGQAGWVLLEGQDSYWLLNGNNFEVRKVADIPIHPDEIYRAWYDWSPGGRLLAFSSLIGPEESDEAFLFIIDTETGIVKRNIALPNVSDAYLPVVEWLADNELLMHGHSLKVLDFRSDPPDVIDLIHDVFLLDIEYPIDISSMDSMPDPIGNDYYIGLRANHPRNQGVYLYESRTGQVRVFQHDTDSLFFSPGGDWMFLPKWEDEPTYRDEYELVWLSTNESEHLVVEGHVPRSHPQIFPKYLPNSSQLVFSSSQGVSLVSIQDKKTVRFWELAGGETAFYQVYPSPSGNALIVVSDGFGIYFIPLPPS